MEFLAIMDGERRRCGLSRKRQGKGNSLTLYRSYTSAVTSVNDWPYINRDVQLACLLYYLFNKNLLSIMCQDLCWVWGLLKRSFLALEELMILMKRQVGKQHFPVPTAKGKSRATRCLWAESQSPELEQLRKRCLDIQGLNKQKDQVLKMYFRPFHFDYFWAKLVTFCLFPKLYKENFSKKILICFLTLQRVIYSLDDRHCFSVPGIFP